ncbi:uncharacterized protein LOC115367397 isoform X2 [Myripristis murdjan]|uniref:uncharacterized protein LOC115367397 isoform X2 n=1 Tax=Myripristis murdjan TaxID=586833 RepID=UPI001175C9DA|nr:uncharacterized protein LOC115367397 isoform X2 [Myripristis murdjan]
MEGLETPYEVEAPVDFIDCTICDKSIRGDTLYKIHLTTAGHLKKESALVARGFSARDHTVPDFEDILQYLQYLNLDEPIIGLTYLEEVPNTDASDPQPGPRYLCKLCDVYANLPNTVNHVIGRKHRQKYLQTKRPDLVTWDRTSMTSQSGKIMRAKAEVVERQDGRGTPKPMKKNRTVGKSNILRAPPKQKMGQNVSQNVSQQQLFDYQDEYSHQGRYPCNDSNVPPFHPNDPYMLGKSDRSTFKREDPLTRDHIGDELQRKNYMESDMYGQEFKEGDYEREYQDDYVVNERRRDLRQPGGVSGRDVRPDMPHRHGRIHPAEAPPHMTPYPESDPLKQFYSEEVRRGQLRSAEAAQTRRNTYPLRDPHGTAYPGRDPDPGRYSSERAYPREGPCGRPYIEESSRDYTSYSSASVCVDEHTRGTGDYSEEETQHTAYPKDESLQPVYPEDEQHQWSLEREQSRHGNINGGGRQGSNDPEAKRRRLPEHMESAQPYDKDHLLEMVRAFRQDRRASHREDAVVNPGPSRPGPPLSQRPVEVVSNLSEIPEPFRRFLQGATQIEDLRKRKRKSRFSDATEEEMERAKGISRNLEGRGPPVHGPQRHDPYPTSQSPYDAEGYQRGSPKLLSEKTAETGVVFDMLKNIEIDNAEEADFLKNQLCSLLKEFQAKKTAHKSQGHTVIAKDYNHLSQEHQAPPQGQYDRTLREGPEGRCFEIKPGQEGDFYSEDAPRGTGWDDQEQSPVDKFQEYSHPAHPGSRGSSRSRYEDVFGRTPHAGHPQEPSLYPERFTEPMRPYDFPPATEEFSEPPFPAPQGYRTHRGPQHSSSLDKITSTLLELVARK